MKPAALNIVPPQCDHPERILDAANHAETFLRNPQQSMSIALEPGDATRYEFTVGVKPNRFYDSTNQCVRYSEIGGKRNGQMFLILHNCGTGFFEYNVDHPYPFPLIEEMSTVGQTKNNDPIWTLKPVETNKLLQSLRNPNPHTALILGTFIAAFNWYRTENGVVRFTETSAQ